MTWGNVVISATSGPKGTAFKPLEIAETLVEQGSEPIGSPGDDAAISRNDHSEDSAETSREAKGRLSNPPQRRLSPTQIDDLVAAYTDGATISQLAANLGVHRTTIGEHLDRKGVPRHRLTWNESTLRDAADLYATGLSLADVATKYGIDAQTVANRFRRAGVPVRPRRGWTSRVHAEHERR